MVGTNTLLPRRNSKQSLKTKRSRRSEIGRELTSEITRKKIPETYRLESEHDLMARFGVSRVTIRWVLADLEHSGLIYREHGRGTFDRGWSTQARRTLGLLLNVPDVFGVRKVVEFMEGAASSQMLEGSSVFVSSSLPVTWGDGVIGTLAGVLVVGDAIPAAELVTLKSHRVPYLVVTRKHLDRHSDCFAFGREVGGALYSYALSGTGLPTDYLSQAVAYAVPIEDSRNASCAATPSRFPVDATLIRAADTFALSGTRSSGGSKELAPQT